MPENTYGFIYEVFHKPSGKKYLGKKVLHFNRTLPPLKGMKRKRKVVKESDWRTYFGSHVEIKQLIKEEKQNEFERRILQFVPTKKLLTYYECKYLFINEVLEHDEYINDNILAKFYRKDFI
jgi:ribosomal protein L39E